MAAAPAPRRRARLESRAGELALEGDSLARSLKAAAGAREAALVEHDVLKLQASGARAPRPCAPLGPRPHAPSSTVPCLASWSGLPRGPGA